MTGLTPQSSLLADYKVLGIDNDNHKGLGETPDPLDSKIVSKFGERICTNMFKGETNY